MTLNAWRATVSTADDPPDYDQTFLTLPEAQAALGRMIKRNFDGAECSDCRAQARDAQRKLSRLRAGEEFWEQIDGDDYRLTLIMPDGSKVIEP